jgi:hypothetical protein
MTTTIERLIDQLRRSAEGDAWHGPSVRDTHAGQIVLLRRALGDGR